jgi:hypothetical protein
MHFTIYQAGRDALLTAYHDSVPIVSSDYVLTFSGNIAGLSSDTEVLTSLHKQFSSATNSPAGFTGVPISLGDIVVLGGRPEPLAYYCNGRSWIPIPKKQIVGGFSDSGSR